MTDTSDGSRECGWYWAQHHSNAEIRPHFRGYAGWRSPYCNTDDWYPDSEFYWLDKPENRLQPPESVPVDPSKKDGANADG